MKYVPRTVTQISPAPKAEDNPSPSFVDYLEASAVVLLGDPGIGKTTEFANARSAESNDMFVTANDFLSRALSRFRGKTLFIDALDEQRAQSKSGIEILNQIRNRLDELSCPRFRLSCRMADWYGAMDADELTKISPDGKLVVLKLDPFTDNDIAHAICEDVTDPTKFIKEARKRGLGDLLHNPQSLKLLTEAVQSEQWPNTRLETFEMAVAELSKEASARHSRTGYGDHSTEAIIDSAGQICTAIMCSNANGVSLSKTASNSKYPWLQDIFDSNEVFQASARRRFFTIQDEHIKPVHRTVAEYLAARHLVRKLREGVSAQRVICLITGPTGETTSDLRGLFAWIPCLSPEFSDTFIKIDPLGVILYGDAAGLSTALKKTLFERLSSLARKDPWFRTSNWASEPFGTLGTPDMMPTLRDILKKQDADPEVKSCALDAIRHGTPMPELGDTLLDYIRGNNGSRLQAVMAFCHACPDRIGELRKVLDEIVAGKVSDPGWRLRSTILRQLYQDQLSIAEVVDYLVVDSPRHESVYDYTLEVLLLEKSSNEDAMRLLDSILRCEKREKMASQYSWQRIVSKLLWRVIRVHGEKVSPEQLYQWLGTGMDRTGHNWIRDKEAKDIRKWLESRPDLYKSLFLHWLGGLGKKKVAWLEHAFFSHRMLEASRPSGFWEFLLSKAAEPGIPEEIAEMLFCMAVNECFNIRTPSALLFDELVEYVERNPCFKELFSMLCKHDFDESHWEVMKKRSGWDQERVVEKNELIEDFNTRIDDIRKGNDWGAMFHLGSVYFYLSEAEKSDDMTPWERIESATTPELAQAAFEGLRSIIQRKAPLTPKQVGISATESKQYNASSVILAGMDIITTDGADILSTVPESTIVLAVAFHLGHGYDTEGANWFKMLVRSRPEIVAGAMLEYIRPQINKKDHLISGIYTLINESEIGDVARTVVPTLLRETPTANHQSLKTLLHAALIHCPLEEIRELVTNTLSRRGAVTGIHRLMWQTVGLMVRKDTEKEIMISARATDTNIREMLDLFMLPWEHGMHVSTSPPVSSIISVILYCGKVAQPRQEAVPNNGEPEGSNAREIGQLIGKAGASGDEKIAARLSSLSSNPKLRPWRSHLLHARAVCLRKAGEANFKPPDSESIIRALSNGPPVNMQDLRAVVLDALKDIQCDILDGASDGYAAYWNVDSHGQPVTPKPENTCRDRIMERLTAILKPKGVRVDREKSHAKGKRSDMSVSRERMSLPIEAKLQNHPALWKALKTQLIDAYSRDPDASSHGVYLVIYHGHYGKPMTAPPAGVSIPLTAADLCVALASTIPDESKPYVSVCVVDVSIKPTKRKSRPKRVVSKATRT